jgi:hypothetical protein
MGPKGKRQILKAIKQTTLTKWYDLKLKLALAWIDVRYSVEEWVLLRTWKWRFKRTKFIKLSSMAYHSDKMGWDDVDVSDQWGHWLPLGFGICSQSNFDFDNKVNRDIGQPEELWQDVSGGDDWKTYWYHDEYLDSRHYFHAARKHLKDKLGADFYEKEIELRLFVQSQKSMDDETKQYLEWVANGSKPLKVEFTDKAKEDMKKLFGEEEAKDLFDKTDERNKEIDEDK